MPVSDGAGANDNKTKVVGGNTIAGQIASFMDSLHLSFREVYEEFPYLLLLLMGKDKLRPVYGEKEEEVVVKKMSGKELMRQKRGG